MVATPCRISYPAHCDGAWRTSLCKHRVRLEDEVGDEERQLLASATGPIADAAACELQWLSAIATNASEARALVIMLYVSAKEQFTW